MKNILLSILWMALAMLCPIHSLFAQLWEQTSSNFNQIEKAQVENRLMPEVFNLYQLEENLLLDLLKNTPLENTGKNSLLTVPMPNGEMTTFEIVQAPIMNKELAQKYPNILTFSGRNLDQQKGAYIRGDWTPQGFHLIVFFNNGQTIYIDPLTIGEQRHYMVYNKNDYQNKASKSFIEFMDQEDNNIQNKKAQKDKIAATQKNTNPPLKSSDSDLPPALKTYRLALAATGEYSNFHGGTTELTLGAMTTTLNRVNGIFEKELSVRLIMVENNDQLIFLDPNNDPYTNGSVGYMMIENHNNIDDVIGNTNYDIGHVFGTSGGGGAHLRAACRNSYKGRGATGISQPIGDPFDVEYVCHEIGHQLGAAHTFNGAEGFCSSNINHNSAYEPGSGTTLMAYQGLCLNANIGDNTGDYFHSHSLHQIQKYTTIGSGSDCAVLLENPNTAPTANAGKDYHIPKGTPFFLKGAGNDENGDNLTYCWEEYDLGIDQNLNNPEAQFAPMFRSYEPTSDPIRYFPKMENILNQNETLGEILPQIGRAFTFRLTVRDNVGTGLGGLNDSDDTNIFVEENAGPFQVGNIATNWIAGSNQTIEWAVANTNTSPILCEKINILLSLDAGLTFSDTLATNVENDGTYNIVVPKSITANARLKIQAANNVFFAVSDNIQIAFPNQPSFGIVPPKEAISICQGETQNIDLAIEHYLGYTENTAVYFNSNTSNNEDFNNILVDLIGQSNNNITASIFAEETVPVGLHSFTATIQANGIENSINIPVYVKPNNPVAPTCIVPNNQSIVNKQNVDFNWSAVWGIDSYQIQLSTDENFVNIIHTQNTHHNSFNWTFNETGNYYYRIKAIGDCGDSSFSPTQTFEINNLASYCEVIGGTNSEWINHITIGPLNNLSGNNQGYAFFPNQLSQFRKNNPYPLQLSPGFLGQSYQEYWRIWIDLNQDGDFEDTGELVFDAGNKTSFMVVGDLTIPDFALIGKTTMRVAMKYNNAPESCEDLNFGEIEDYPIEIHPCQPISASDQTAIWIESFQLGDLYNVSGNNNGYGNFQHINAHLLPNQTYFYQVNVNEENTQNKFLNAWIDANQDGHFTETEKVIEEIFSAATMEGYLMLPDNIETGKSLLKVIISNQPVSNACASTINAEAEEYQIFILDNTLIDTDGDGILDFSDNCETTFNPTQSDQNNNNIGDLCDAEPDEEPNPIVEPTSVSITIMLEGPYLPSSQTMHNQLTTNNILPTSQPFSELPYQYTGNENIVNIPTNAVDWVLVEARLGTPSIGGSEGHGTTLIEQKAALVLQDGSVVGTDGNALSFSNLEANTAHHFLIRHRNHLDIISAQPYQSNTIEIDFTSSVSMAYGPEQLKMIDGKACLHAGEFNRDGNIQISDYDAWYALPASLLTYSNTDANLDGIVQTTDFDLWFTNKAKLGIFEVSF